MILGEATADPPRYFLLERTLVAARTLSRQAPKALPAAFTTNPEIEYDLLKLAPERDPLREAGKPGHGPGPREGATPSRLAGIRGSTQFHPIK